MINLTINGKKLQAKKGMTILDVAQSADIYIPTLCYHKKLKPYGGCRLCIVEVDGMQGFPTACTTPVEEGMVIRTDTDEIQRLRRNILELILSEHPYTCLVCDQREECKDYQGTIRKVGVTTGCEYCPKNGNCELQKIADYLGLKEIKFPITYKSLSVEKYDPFFDRDYNLCILCGRCVRICEEIRGTSAIAFTYRGSKTTVGTAFGKSHLESGCEFCGACVDVCPTGALYEKRNKWEGTPEYSIDTICPYCGVGCTIKLNVKENRVIGSVPSPDGKINQGQGCVRGRFCITEVVHSPNRLKTPLIRKNGNLVEAGWDEALDIIAKNLSKNKGDIFAFISSPQCTNEDIYIFKKFTQVVMNSNNIATTGKIENIETIKNGECNLMGALNIVGVQSFESLLKKIGKGEVKALYLTDNIAKKYLKKLDFLIVQSVFPIPANEFANVILPASSFAEIDGTFTNINGEVQSLHKVIEPLYNSRPDWWVVCEIAKRLNAQGFDFKNSQEINSEISRIYTRKTIENRKQEISPTKVKPSDGFFNYRGCSLIEEVKGLKEVVNHYGK